MKGTVFIHQMCMSTTNQDPHFTLGYQAGTKPISSRGSGTEQGLCQASPFCG